MMWSVIGTLAAAVSMTWMLNLIGGLVCQSLLVGTKPKVEAVFHAFVRLHQELWIVAPPGLILGAIENWHSKTPWTIVFSAINLWLWWHHRDWPDENRWKRRAKKAKEAVAEVAGRLVVVPAGASS